MYIFKLLVHYNYNFNTQKFGLPDDRQNDLSVVAVQPSGEHSLLVTWSHNSKKIFNKPPTSALQVSGWPQQGCWGQDSDSTGSEFVATRDHQQLLSDMLMSHHGADFCLVGAKVCLSCHINI